MSHLHCNRGFHNVETIRYTTFHEIHETCHSIMFNFIIIVVIVTWPEKFDFVLVPEHDVTNILT